MYQKLTNGIVMLDEYTSILTLVPVREYFINFPVIKKQQTNRLDL